MSERYRTRAPASRSGSNARGERFQRCGGGAGGAALVPPVRPRQVGCSGPERAAVPRGRYACARAPCLVRRAGDSVPRPPGGSRGFSASPGGKRAQGGGRGVVIPPDPSPLVSERCHSLSERKGSVPPAVR